MIHVIMFYVNQKMCYVLQLCMGFEPIIGRKQDLIIFTRQLPISWKKQCLILGENFVKCIT